MDNNWLPNEPEGIHRRTFLAMMGVAGAGLAGVTLVAKRAAAEAFKIQEMKKGEDVFAYTKRIKGKFDQTLYQQVIGAANDFKEGDLTIGVGARDEATRKMARDLLANTKIRDLYEHPLFVDNLQKLIWKTTDQAQYGKVKDWTLRELKEFLLTRSEPEIKGIMNGLTSDTIGCVPKLMTNDERNRGGFTWRNTISKKQRLSFALRRTTLIGKE